MGPIEVTVPAVVTGVPRRLPLKRPFDVALAAVILLLSLPVLLPALLLVRLTSPGPAIYRQKRVGKGGRVFTIFKVRSMGVDSETGTGPMWCVPGDPRVTPVGHWLRKLHVDELPQLWNVLRGDMSLIGPRPERPEFVERLTVAVPGYEQRHAVLPGITGLAQVQLGPDTDVANVERKLKYDLYYIRHASWAWDVVILALTALKVVGVPLTTLCHLTRLDREPWFRPENAFPVCEMPPLRRAA